MNNLINVNYNPDVLSCIANLSSDEVFTPPKLVNEILDILPQELFADKETRFLDPFCKSGVFLREITKRLIKGLENEIPDLQKRLNHIFTRQIYGIAITELTALLSRRSVYCSKIANGKYSVCTVFNNEKGNIRFEQTEHSWKDGKCVFCSASEENYNREEGLEIHAYELLHTEKPEEILKMKFDVIIGNPPYQLSDGGHGKSASPIYHRFVEQAKKLKPRFLTMIIPARWYSGGKGLDEFRNNMLNDKQLITLVDYFDSTECFPGVDISGGICYFLWGNNTGHDKCKIISHLNGITSEQKRNLIEKKVGHFIRFNEANSIIEKIYEFNENKFIDIVSARKPFGFGTKVKVYESPKNDFVKIYAYPKSGYIKRNSIKTNTNAIDKFKLFIAKAYGERGSFPYLVTAKPFIGEKNSCCSETYLMIGPVKNKSEAINIQNYIATKFFRFLVLLQKNTQDSPRRVFTHAPLQDFSEEWNDEKLNTKYKLTLKEISFINEMVRPMELDNV